MGRVSQSLLGRTVDSWTSATSELARTVDRPLTVGRSANRPRRDRGAVTIVVEFPKYFAFLDCPIKSSIRRRDVCNELLCDETEGGGKDGKDKDGD